MLIIGAKTALLPPFFLHLTVLILKWRRRRLTTGVEQVYFLVRLLLKELLFDFVSVLAHVRGWDRAVHDDVLMLIFFDIFNIFS